MNDITIKKVANGLIITVGCRTFVSTDIPKVMREIEKYLNDPGSTTEEYMKKYPWPEDFGIGALRPILRWVD